MKKLSKSKAKKCGINVFRVLDSRVGHNRDSENSMGSNSLRFHSSRIRLPWEGRLGRRCKIELKLFRFTLALRLGTLLSYQRSFKPN
jgi:hypothetical protein